ncbi:hypothetical protein EYS14_22360 [Alteromonadaceae bacterium M269]|nr:hypothetical protein EYS14_22360 [Alteromonadaceae bacterium M269]
MIIRTWKAITTEVKEPEYKALVESIVLPYFKTCMGYQGCKFGRRNQDSEGKVEILVMTFWESMEAVTAFSGDPGAHAYLPEEIAKTLESYDSTSEHFETFIEQ